MHTGEEDQHQDLDRTPRGRATQNDRGTELNGESYIHGVANPRTAKEQKRTEEQVGIMPPEAGRQAEVGRRSLRLLAAECS